MVARAAPPMLFNRSIVKKVTSHLVSEDGLWKKEEIMSYLLKSRNLNLVHGRGLNIYRLSNITYYFWEKYVTVASSTQRQSKKRIVCALKHLSAPF